MRTNNLELAEAGTARAILKMRQFTRQGLGGLGPLVDLFGAGRTRRLDHDSISRVISTIGVWTRSNGSPVNSINDLSIMKKRSYATSTLRCGATSSRAIFGCIHRDKRTG